MRLRTHFLTVLLMLPVLAAGLVSFAPLNPRLDAYRTRMAARDQVLVAKNILGVEIAKGSGRVDAARGLYEARDAAWRAVMAPPDSVPAFPGAVGAGATALIACRSLPLKVWKVQNLSASASTDGGLRAILADSVSSSNFDVIVFDTAGTLSARVRDLDDKNCVYVAAQTARGGLQINPGASNGGVSVGSSHPTGGPSDLVWRYTHARCTINAANTNDCMGVYGKRSAATNADIIFDHNSVSGGNDEIIVFPGFSVTSGGSMLRVTLSNSIIYGVAAHHKAGGMTGVGAYPTCNASGASVFRNLFSLASQRGPPNVGIEGTVTGVCAELINNANFNVVNRQSTASDSSLVDYERNWTDDTSTPSGDGWSVSKHAGQNCDGSTGAKECQKIYVNKSIWETSDVADIDTTVDQWQTVCVPATSQCGHAAVDSTKFRSYTALFGTPKFPVTQVQAALVPSELFGTGATMSNDSISIGANGWIGCSGASVVVGRGSLTGAGFTRLTGGFDSLAISDVFTNFNRAVSNSLLDYAPGGVLPTFTAAGPRCADSDGDGVPDLFETSHTNSQVLVADADSDLDEDGWTLIEEYVNGSDPDIFTSALGEEGGTPGPVVTFGNGRWIYQDTLVRYLQITAGGADTDSVFMPDTSDYSPTALGPFTYILKDLSPFVSGDTVLILINDSIVGREAKKLDSGQVDSLAGTVSGGEGQWSKCVSRGICTDSLRNRDIP